jgi:hypothetical protein
MQNLFSLDHQIVTLKAIKLRAELKEENGLLDVELFFVARMGNDALVMIAPDLRSLLYKRGEQMTTDSDEPGLTELRMPELEALNIKKEIVGADVTLHYGVGESNGRSTDISLPDTKKIDTFYVLPMQGGTNTIGWRVCCKPQFEQLGDIGRVLGREAPLTIVTPEDKQGSLGV